jgi:hypothetical protein
MTNHNNAKRKVQNKKTKSTWNETINPKCIRKPQG